jgi:hypothetical protein
MPRTPDFDGETYDRDRDHERLASQLRRVRDLMSDGRWHTLSGMSHALGDPESSISARIRDLRKRKFGGYTVERQYAGDGLWEYRILARETLFDL